MQYTRSQKVVTGIMLAAASAVAGGIHSKHAEQYAGIKQTVVNTNVDAPTTQNTFTNQANILRVDTPLIGPAPAEVPHMIAAAPSSYKSTNLHKETETLLLARLLFGEARNCSQEEKIAIAWTVLNRVKTGEDKDIRHAILRGHQYSCFNSDDPNVSKLKNPEKMDAKSWEDCWDISIKVLTGEYGDPTAGATNYTVKGLRVGWIRGMVACAEAPEFKHQFYRVVSR